MERRADVEIYGPAKRTDLTGSLIIPSRHVLVLWCSTLLKMPLHQLSCVARDATVSTFYGSRPGSDEARTTRSLKTASSSSSSSFIFAGTMVLLAQCLSAELIFLDVFETHLHF